MLIEKKKSNLLIIDVQEKLVSVMPKPHTFIDKITKLQKAANILDIPIILSEQYPKGLGKTIDKIKTNMGVNNTIIEKTEFSVQIKKTSYPKHFIICGIDEIRAFSFSIPFIKSIGYNYTSVSIHQIFK